MNYQALIFDMDGTLVHNMPTHNQAWQDVLAEAGIAIDPVEFNRSTTGKKNTEILHMLFGDTMSAADILYWTERKETLYRQRYAGSRRPLPGLVELLEWARSISLPMAVATSAPPENVGFILDELDLRRHFRVVVGAQDIQNGKPHPEIFLKAAERLGMRPADCLVFEDALGGIEAARRAGMDSVMICTTIDAQEVAGREHVLCAVPDFNALDLRAILGVLS